MKEILARFGFLTLIPAAMAFSPESADSLDTHVNPSNVQTIENIVDWFDNEKNRDDFMTTGGFVVTDLAAWWFAKRFDDGTPKISLERGLLWAIPPTVTAVSAVGIYNVWV